MSYHSFRDMFREEHCIIKAKISLMRDMYIHQVFHRLPEDLYWAIILHLGQRLVTQNTLLAQRLVAVSTPVPPPPAPVPAGVLLPHCCTLLVIVHLVERSCSVLLWGFGDYA